VFRNLDAVLRAGGSKPSLVVNTTVLVADIDSFSELNIMFGEFFSENPPARMTMQVPLPARTADLDRMRRDDTTAGRGSRLMNPADDAACRATEPRRLVAAGEVSALRYVRLLGGRRAGGPPHAHHRHRGQPSTSLPVGMSSGTPVTAADRSRRSHRANRSRHRDDHARSPEERKRVACSGR
jgi:enamine deaminase RidA (YjgF/YER057c/UK114 family)